MRAELAKRIEEYACLLAVHNKLENSIANLEEQNMQQGMETGKPTLLTAQYLKRHIAVGQSCPKYLSVLKLIIFTERQRVEILGLKDVIGQKMKVRNTVPPLKTTKFSIGKLSPS